MSPRRKSGLSKDDLDALKHLPAVLTAVRKVTALGMDLQAAVAGPQKIVVPAPSDMTPERMAALRAEVEAFQSRGYLHPADARYTPPPEASPKSATLDTPERREYEEAKRAGRKVPVADPFANASPAQRERMAEQRAIIDAERAARGLPTRGGRGGRDRFDTEVAAKIRAVEEANAAGLIPPDAAAEVVRTEVLDTVSDGTTPLASDADEDPEVH